MGAVKYHTVFYHTVFYGSLLVRTRESYNTVLYDSLARMDPDFAETVSRGPRDQDAYARAAGSSCRVTRIRIWCTHIHFYYLTTLYNYV